MSIIVFYGYENGGIGPKIMKLAYSGAEIWHFSCDTVVSMVTRCQECHNLRTIGQSELDLGLTEPQ